RRVLINRDCSAIAGCRKGRACVGGSKGQSTSCGGERHAQLRFHDCYPSRVTTAAVTSISFREQPRQSLFFGLKQPLWPVKSGAAICALMRTRPNLQELFEHAAIIFKERGELRPKIDCATERKVRKQLAKGVGILKVARSLGIG